MLPPFTLSAEQWKDAVRMGGGNAWMNNDHQLNHSISYGAYRFLNVEAAYKFAKFQQFSTENRELLSACINPHCLAQEVRDLEYRLRSVLKISDHWEEARYGIMLVLNREKYLYNIDLAERLLETHPHPIVEVSRGTDRAGKPWGDRYWGVCIGSDGEVVNAEGCNAMGRIAMCIRDEMRDLTSSMVI